MNKTIWTCFIILCLLSTVFLLGSVLNSQIVKAGGTIYIRADGSIDGPANITTVDYVTYTFNESNYDEIVVERGNIIVDGANYTLQGTGIGLNLANVNNITIKNTNIKSYYYGIRLYYCSHNMIKSNNISGNGEGIWLYGSSHNMIKSNNISGNGEGIYLDKSLNNTIADNIIVNNDYGIPLYKSSNNTIADNIIVNNDYGIRIISSNSLFYHNNLIDNTGQVNVPISGYANFWDNTIEGNYWSDYNGTDSDRDGIGDTYYQIDSDNTDNHPLMGLFHGFNTSIGCPVNVISNSTIENFTYFNSNDTIRIHVFNMTETQTYGFCRICIPHALMNVSSISVAIDDGLTEVLYFNDTIYDNDTHRWIYFAYEHSMHEIVIVPEFPKLIILYLFIIATLLTVTVHRRKHLM